MTNTTKFKVGDKVKIIKNYGIHDFNKYIGTSHVVCEIDESRFNAIGLRTDKTTTMCSEEELELAERTEITWQNFEAGDVIVDINGIRAKVLARLGDVFLKSMRDGLNAASNWLTITEAQSYGWTFEQPKKDEAVEMTVSEISKALGKTIKVVKE